MAWQASWEVSRSRSRCSWAKRSCVAIERLSELGITLPAVAAPVAAYVPAIRVGDQVWTSGQLPFVDGKLPAVGKLGADITIEQGTDYARQAALNALAAVDALVGINNVKRVLKVVGFVASADGFMEQPAVVNGASNLIGEIFGEVGAHRRPSSLTLFFCRWGATARQRWRAGSH